MPLPTWKPEAGICERKAHTGALSSHPGGMKARSRWLSAATPPVIKPKGTHPEGMPARSFCAGRGSPCAGIPSGCIHTLCMFVDRWRRCAQPPSPGWHASGIHWQPKKCSARPGAPSGRLGQTTWIPTSAERGWVVTIVVFEWGKCENRPFLVSRRLKVGENQCQ